MAFHEVRLPDDVERGAQGGPRFKTTVIILDSGFERRNIDWSQARGAWDVGYGIDDKTAFSVVLTFFRAREGRAHGFRFKDWSDFELARQSIGVTDTSNTLFQIFKRYTSGTINYDRTLNKIVSGTVSVWVNNIAIIEGAGASEYQIDLNTGIITIGATLAAQSGTLVEAQCEFDVPVRFDNDQISVNMEIFNAGQIPNIQIIEIRQ